MIDSLRSLLEVDFVQELRYAGAYERHRDWQLVQAEERTVTLSESKGARKGADGGGGIRRRGVPSERLKQLKELLAAGLVTQSEFKTKRTAILDEV